LDLMTSTGRAGVSRCIRGTGKGRENRSGHTKDDDIEDQDNQTDNSTAGAILPCVRLMDRFLGDRGGERQSGHADLGEEAGEKSVLHLDCLMILLDGVLE